MNAFIKLVEETGNLYQQKLLVWCKAHDYVRLSTFFRPWLRKQAATMGHGDEDAYADGLQDSVLGLYEAAAKIATEGSKGPIFPTLLVGIMSGRNNWRNLRKQDSITSSLDRNDGDDEPAELAEDWREKFNWLELYGVASNLKVKNAIKRFSDGKFNLDEVGLTPADLELTVKQLYAKFLGQDTPKVKAPTVVDGKVVWDCVKDGDPNSTPIIFEAQFPEREDGETFAVYAEAEENEDGSFDWQDRKMNWEEPERQSYTGYRTTQNADGSTTAVRFIGELERPSRVRITKSDDLVNVYSYALPDDDFEFDTLQPVVNDPINTNWLTLSHSTMMATYYGLMPKIGEEVDFGEMTWEERDEFDFPADEEELGGYHIPSIQEMQTDFAAMAKVLQPYDAGFAAAWMRGESVQDCYTAARKAWMKAGKAKDKEQPVKIVSANVVTCRLVGEGGKLITPKQVAAFPWRYSSASGDTEKMCAVLSKMGADGVKAANRLKEYAQ